MIKKIFLFPVIIFFFFGSTITAQINLDEDFENVSNQEFIKSLNRFIKLVDWFASLSEADEDIDITKEKILPAYQTDTVNSVNSFHNFLDSRFTLLQSFNEKGSEFSILDEDNFRFSSDDNSINLTIDRIYFCDGSIEKSDASLDMHFANEIDTRKRIDSISCHVVTKYNTQVDKVELTKSNKNATYNGKQIKIEEIDKNRIIISYDSDLHPFLVEGLNIKKQVLSNYKSFSSSKPPKEAREIYSKMRKELGIIHTKAILDSSISQTEFQKKYIPKLKVITEQFSNSDVKYKEIYYNGYVDGIRLYFVKKENSLQAKKLIRNKDKDDIFIGYSNNSGETTLYDKLGNILFQDTISYTSINSYYYEDSTNFYYFDSNNKKMMPLLYYDIEGLNSEYVKVQTDEKEKYILLNKNNEQEVPDTFNTIKYKENIIYAVDISQNKIFFITDKGIKKWLTDISLKSDFVNGYAVIKKGEKYGFIDNNINIIIPVTYDDVEEFDSFDYYAPEDNLFVVKKGDLWGCVSAKNEIVIPFMYKELKPFSYGITLAENKEGKIGLINRNNKIVVPFEYNGYGLSKNFGKRMYSFGNDKNYDNQGKRIKE